MARVVKCSVTGEVGDSSTFYLEFMEGKAYRIETKINLNREIHIVTIITTIPPNTTLLSKR